MLKFSVSKSHPVTRYEVAPTERQTEDVLVEPVSDCQRFKVVGQIGALCFVCYYWGGLDPSVVFGPVESPQSGSLPPLQFCF